MNKLKDYFSLKHSFYFHSQVKVSRLVCLSWFDGDEDIQAQGHGEEELDQDIIPDLGEPMTRGRLRKAKETLQHKVTNLLEAQLLNEPHFKKTKLITCTTCLEY